MDPDGMQEMIPAPDRVRIILPPAFCLRRRQAGDRYNIKIEGIKSRKNMLILQNAQKVPVFGHF